MSRVKAFVISAALLAVATPAHAATSHDLYMVDDVQFVNGVHIGDFIALRKTGKRVVGASGAFGSEYVCLRGKVAGGKLRVAYYDRGEVVAHFARAWRGDHVKGMTAATKAEMRTYLGSSPARFLAICERQTS